MESPIKTGIIYEGERIRRPDMWVEFGSSAKYKAELCEIVDKPIPDKVSVIGPELNELKEGTTNSIFLHILAYGKKLEKEFEPVLERRIHEIINSIHGCMHLNQRADIWIRISKEIVKDGVRLKHIGHAISDMLKQQFPSVEKVQLNIITDENSILPLYKHALQVYEARDARVMNLRDEDVDTFYGCTLCQSFAPKHVCVISPNRISLCGTISWFDARAAANIDPHGANFSIPKGKVIDIEKGEYEGVNKIVEEKSGGATKRVFMYSMFDLPCTSCGCFESIAFYIAEVDGIGIIDRKFKDTCVNGLTFGDMASQTGGGEQIVGFLGMALSWMKSPKFLSADGGWNRIVYLPKNIKDKFVDSIPKELQNKIATEQDVKNIKELKDFLQNKGHPIVQRWRKQKQEEKPVISLGETTQIQSQGFNITLKNAKIYAEKIIIQKT